MATKIETIEAYIEQLAPDRKNAIGELRQIMLNNLPEGFEETLSYGMIGYVVPHKLYPAGYHCNPKLPLPFINLASQKKYISLYHMGLYANSELLKWFEEEYKKRALGKLDMGKCCIRFKRIGEIPYDLIMELCGKMTPMEWVDFYERARKK